MPYDLKEVAAISGMPGLYRLLKPTRAGVIIEALDERGTRSVASARNKVSLLHEISIYTQDYDQTVPLTEVFDRIYQKYGTDLPLSNKSDDRDLTAFMGDIIPDYDRDRVYMSDIKKLVTWYRAVSTRLEYQAPTAEETTEEASADTASAPAKAKKKAGKKDDEPAKDEAMSTAGIIPATEETNAEGNPEAATSAKKSSKKKAE
ncbi:hypothetical protein SAMN06265337_1070 [Hymenobacter gelipurpurascens]|uniref:Uncharacterized protein n=1 Tax=Hymenobacter gelipurpurascens TaxID=89968 RepID=A0A212TEC8_9BACT|nr:DUF5606 domain-containing protein [Hymenobacter gelipurpurascens]SNC64389.1 hypothetical protein SAMN06265337_1070 [Hymenobacter gelipurpurascens]